MNENEMLEIHHVINPHISVDCVLFGFDGMRLNVLLVRQTDSEIQEDTAEYKLPGSLIYEDEDLDEAAKRVLFELTGLKSILMMQFRAFGSLSRIRNPKDIKWLEHFHSLSSHVQRIVTVAYSALLKIDHKYMQLSNSYEAKWIPLQDVGKLAFDHNEIIVAALKHIQYRAELEPCILFSLLPRKFTAAQLHTLFQLVYNKKFDIRNFHKRIAKMPYVTPLEEKEIGVAHRAARFYHFDRIIYNKSRK